LILLEVLPGSLPILLPIHDHSKVAGLLAGH